MGEIDQNKRDTNMAAYIASLSGNGSFRPKPEQKNVLVDYKNNLKAEQESPGYKLTKNGARKFGPGVGFGKSPEQVSIGARIDHRHLAADPIERPL